MARKRIPLVTGQHYHLFNRGVAKQPIFFNNYDYKRAIRLMEYYSYDNLGLSYSKFLQLTVDERDNRIHLQGNGTKLVEIVCMCLMPNHFHFLVKQLEDGGIQKFMSNFQNGLTKYVNIRRERVGPLLQGEFKSVHVEDDSQLLHLSRYIHLNPYTSFVVRDLVELESYPWSSYPNYLQEKGTKYNKDIILSQFKDRASYKQFVNDQAAYQRELDMIKHLILED